MTRKIILLLAAATGAFALTANAVPVKFKFQEFGDIGHTYIFHDDGGGFALTASAFFTSGADTNLFGDSGIGTTGDPSTENKIATTTFIQLTIPTSPASIFQSISIGDIDTASGESANIYFTTTAGSLVGAILLGTLTADGSFAIGPLFQNGFIDITAGSGNVLLTGAQVSSLSSVPETGFTASLLGMGLVGLATLRRKLHA